MKKILVYLFAFILAFSCLTLCVGCDDEEGSDLQTSVEYDYVKASGNEGDEDYVAAHYVISGITVSSDDAEKLDTESDDYDETFKITDDFGNVVFDNATRTLTVPEKYSEKNKEATVTEIGLSAFANKSYIEKIVVGSNITKIGEGAFNGCIALEEITLPFIGEEKNSKNEKKLMGFVFGSSSNDEDLETETEMKVNSSTGASSQTYYIPNSLKKITITDTDLVRLPECTFYGFSTVKEIVLPDSITTVCKYAFYGCSALESIEMKNVVSIYDYAFAECTKLHDFTMENLEVIGDNAFECCENLYTSVLGEADLDTCTMTIGNKIKEVGKNAFANCTGLIKLVVTADVKFDSNAFEGCTGLKYVSCTGKVTAGENMFKDCSALKSSSVSGISGDLGLDD